MKILFYVEPHPIRDSFSSHSYPLNIFSGICREIVHPAHQEKHDDVDIRIFSSHVLQELKFKEIQDIWPLVITPTTSEQEKIEQFANLWFPTGVCDWLELSTNPNSEISKFYLEILYRIKKDVFDFDTIVLWGQNSAVKYFAEETGTQTVYFELASIRPPFPRALLLDPIGVNGAASSTYLDVEDIKRHINHVPSDITFSILNDEFHETRQSSNLYRSLYSPNQALLDCLPDSPVPTALIPLQLSDDANLLLFSSHATIDSFVDEAITLLIKNGWHIILKPHPHAALRGGQVERAQAQCLNKYNNHQNIRILGDETSETDYISLLANVDLVVTNNSSAGFEALLSGTQCVTLGRACYSIKNALPSLECYLSADTSLKAHYKKNAEFIVSYMLAFTFPLQRSLADQLILRIKLWRNLTPPPAGNPSEWIKANLDAIGWATWHNEDIAREVFIAKTFDKATSVRNIKKLELEA